jgi:hypothetical protein
MIFRDDHMLFNLKEGFDIRDFASNLTVHSQGNVPSNSCHSLASLKDAICINTDIHEKYIKNGDS